MSNLVRFWTLTRTTVPYRIKFDTNLINNSGFSTKCTVVCKLYQYICIFKKDRFDCFITKSFIFKLFSSYLLSIFYNTNIIVFIIRKKLSPFTTYIIWTKQIFIPTNVKQRVQSHDIFHIYCQNKIRNHFRMTYLDPKSH